MAHKQTAGRYQKGAALFVPLFFYSLLLWHLRLHLIFSGQFKALAIDGDASMAKHTNISAEMAHVRFNFAKIIGFTDGIEPTDESNNNKKTA